MPKTARYAVITPYHKESRETLQRCLASVRGQDVKADHILVADGFAQGWLDGEGVRHLKLDSAHADYGNVARGLGGLLAIADDYEGFGFLDADNWLDEDHVSACVACAGTVAATRVDLVIAQRRHVRLDGTDMHVPEEPDHIDTNCYWFLGGSYSAVPHWVSMPRELSSIGDRVFREFVAESNFSMRQVPKATINYTCLWEPVYRMRGETPPANAKPPITPKPAYTWLLSLDEARRRHVAKLAGVDMVWDAARYMAKYYPEEADVKCPCGSGKAYRACHGAVGG